MVGKSALLTSRSRSLNIGDQRIRVYLDGLDEIPVVSRRWEVLGLARKTAEQDANIQIILTSREYVYDRQALWLPTLRLSEFEEAQSELLIAGWLTEQASEVQSFRAQLQAAETLKPLMRIPLLATLIILVFRQTRRLPENRTRLYEMFIDLLSGGWDLAKGVQRGSSFGSVVKLMVLRRLAAKVHLDGKRNFGAVDLKYTIRTTLSSKFMDHWEGLEQELLQDGIITKVGVAYEFSHLSFQEFLAARDLLGDPTSMRAEVVLEKFLRGEDWWREVLSFYAGLAGKPNEILAWLSEAKTKWSVSVEGAEKRANSLIQSIVQSLPDYIGT